MEQSCNQFANTNDYKHFKQELMINFLKTKQRELLKLKNEWVLDLNGEWEKFSSIEQFSQTSHLDFNGGNVAEIGNVLTGAMEILAHLQEQWMYLSQNFKNASVLHKIRDNDLNFSISEELNGTIKIIAAVHRFCKYYISISKQCFFCEIFRKLDLENAEDNQNLLKMVTEAKDKFRKIIVAEQKEMYHMVILFSYILFAINDIYVSYKVLWSCMDLKILKILFFSIHSNVLLTRYFFID